MSDHTPPTDIYTLKNHWRSGKEREGEVEMA